jgi:hypothetical protein
MIPESLALVSTLALLNNVVEYAQLSAIRLTKTWSTM